MKSIKSLAFILLIFCIHSAFAGVTCTYGSKQNWTMRMLGTDNNDNLYIFSVWDKGFKYSSGLMELHYTSGSGTGYFRDVDVLRETDMVRNITINGTKYSPGKLIPSSEYGIDYSMSSERIFELCKESASPIYQSTQTETQVLACPATQPSGIWTQSRTYELWSDGSHRNLSAWVDATKTCVAIKQSIQTESRTVNCAVGEIGSVKETQTYEIWTDGSKKNYSGWKVSSKTCKAIPTTITETKDGVQEETCDSYFGVAQGTYTGTVYKQGTYTTTYSITTKSTDTKFEVKTVVLSSCVAQITDIIQETDELACPAGQTGSIQRYRIKATNSQGQISYPYGNQWVVSNNNCASIQVDNQPTVKADTAPDGLLSNISVTSSSLQNGEAFSNYLNSLSASNWATSERHKLIVTIDDLSSGKYSASKVGAIISKFQSVVGAGNSDIEIALPRTIDKYTGNGDITAKAVKDKTVMMKDVSFEGGDVILTYMQLSKKTIEKPQSKEIVINVIPKNLSFKGIFAN